LYSGNNNRIFQGNRAENQDASDIHCVAGLRAESLAVARADGDGFLHLKCTDANHGGKHMASKLHPSVDNLEVGAQVTDDELVNHGVNSNAVSRQAPIEKGKGLTLSRFFTASGRHPFDEQIWERRSAVITNEKGDKVFEQIDVEVPAAWSQMATNVVVSKYFNGKLGTPNRENSVRQLIDRVARTIRKWGERSGYFATLEDANVFYEELAHLLVNQKLSFNSPVWFNCGIEEKPQCSACFINSVEDHMESILELAKTENMLFK
jgi:hypothetical protein